jgi:hypothetical protein
MSPQRFAVLAVLGGTLVLNGWVAAGLAGLGLPGSENGGARIAADTPRATAIAKDSVAKDSVDRVSDTGIIGAASPGPEVLPPARIASASKPDQMQNDVEASAPSVEVAGTGSVAALPEPREVPSAARIVSASTFDQMQNDVEAPAPPVEVAKIESVGAASPGPCEMPPPARIASASSPDQKQNDVEASAPLVKAAEIEGVGAAVPDPREMLPPVRIASASTPDPMQNDVEASARSVEVAGTDSVAALPEPQEMPPAKPPGPLVSLFGFAPLEEKLKPAARPVETPNECLVAEICIDDYLWSFYEQTPKVDTNKVTERIKAAVKKKGKIRTVIKTIFKYVVADFAWKDPIAAQKAGMSVKDYVIGGMDRGFKQKLYYALHAMDDAGLMPGITSAFRDDYRQSIASGNKAASDSSYHGGSRRGGYGHGLAADLVSLKGETRLERFASSILLWKWIDAHEKELGIARPYLDRDPPHVGPIDGQEYAAKRGGAKARLAQSIMKKRQPAVLGGHPGATKPATKAGPVTASRGA